VVLVTVLIAEQPRIPDEDRAEVIEITEGITRVILHYGFMQYPTIFAGLTLARKQASSRTSTSPTSPTTSAANHYPARGHSRHVGVARVDLRVPAAQCGTDGGILRRACRQVVEFGTEIEI